MQPSDLTIARSLEAARKFAGRAVPLLARSFEHAVQQARDVPIGGIADPAAQLQALPNLVRLNLIQLVLGTNSLGGEAQIKRKGSPNNGLWLGLVDGDMMARVYKEPGKYRINPSGKNQEDLINQVRYKRLFEQPELPLGIDEPMLNALLIWRSRGFELESAFVVIPYGWGEDYSIVELARQEVPIPDSIEELAQFESTVELLQGDIPILAEGYDSELEDVRLEESVKLPEDDDAVFESSEESIDNPRRKDDEHRK